MTRVSLHHKRWEGVREGDIFACHKYISPENTTINGGLFHAMFEFILNNKELNYLEEELKKIKPNANIVGPVQLVEDGRNSIANFRIISSILAEEFTLTGHIDWNP